ncbi:hypothetical protein [Microlunatus sagamiharensis]|uniref:hypothetical protein n=1 Tax=Microlunatus sagamiharensis TaxID=546874 RepID=UPI0012FE1AD3|nr:hypothetical protein [Microlunatus sagamiharensis]
MMIDEFEVIAAEGDEETLTRLRPAINVYREAGARVLLISRYPASRFPRVSGNSIVHDCQNISVTTYSIEHARAFLDRRGISELDAQARLHQHADGSAALLETFSEIETSEGSGNQKRERATSAIYSVAISAFKEVGPEVCAWLESMVFEQRAFSCTQSEVPPEVSEALLGAGIARVTVGPSDQIELLPRSSREVWEAALGDFLEQCIDPLESWRQLAGEIFTLERLLRQALAASFRAEYGDVWAGQVLESRTESILAQVRRDVSPHATSLNDVRSPLDWLTLESLLELGEEQVISLPGLVGMTRDQWSNLRFQVVSIRNRFAHMRISRLRDLETVRSAVKLLQLRILAAEQRGDIRRIGRLRQAWPK